MLCPGADRSLYRYLLALPEESRFQCCIRIGWFQFACNWLLDDMICNTSGVLNPKICHVIICIVHHCYVNENFDMHSLKQVYFYDNMCWLVWVKSCSKPLYWIGFQNPNFQHLNSTLQKPNSKSKHVLELSQKGKV